MKQLETMKFLVIDDSDIIRQSTRALLVKLGASRDNVYMAGDASRAYMECCRNKFDVFIVDFNLGKGSNGLQLLEKLYRDHVMKDDSIVLVVTADNSSQVIHGFLGFDVNGLLVKPLKPDVLKSTLHNCIEEQASAAHTIEIYKKQGLSSALNSLKVIKTKKAYDKAIVCLCSTISASGQSNVAKKILAGYLGTNSSIQATRIYCDISFEEGDIASAERCLAGDNGGGVIAFGRLDTEARMLVLKKKTNQAADVLEKIYDKSPYQLSYVYAYTLMVAGGLADGKHVKKSVKTWLKWSKGSIWDHSEHKLCFVLALIECDRLGDIRSTWNMLMKDRVIGKKEIAFIKILEVIVGQGEREAAIEAVEELGEHKSFEYGVMTYKLGTILGNDQLQEHAEVCIKNGIEEEASPLLRDIKRSVYSKVITK